MFVQQNPRSGFGSALRYKNISGSALKPVRIPSTAKREQIIKKYRSIFSGNQLSRTPAADRVGGAPPAEEDLSTDSSNIFPPSELLEAATTPTGGAPFQTLPTPDPPPFPTPNGSRILDASADLPPPPLDLLPPPANSSLVLDVTASELPPPPSEACSPSLLPSGDPALSSQDDVLNQPSTICDSESGLSPGELGRRSGSFLAVFFGPPGSGSVIYWYGSGFDSGSGYLHQHAKNEEKP
jgi:hypothetical protein